MNTSAMRLSRPLLPILMTILLASCATASQPAMSPATFVVVRHAEKIGDGSRDPLVMDASAVITLP